MSWSPDQPAPERWGTARTSEPLVRRRSLPETLRYLAQKLNEPLTDAERAGVALTLNSLANETEAGQDAFTRALTEELSHLWTDLQTARRDAINGQWSMHCDWLVERIKTITPLVGPTPWTELDIELIEDGVYQRIHAEIGVDAPYDEEGVRRHRARLNVSAGRSSGEEKNA